MTKHLFSLFILVCTTTAMFSCRKDGSGSFVPYTTGMNDTTWSPTSPVKKSVASSFLSELENKPFVDSFDCSTGAQFAWGDSLQIILPPYAYYTGAGTIVTGKIIMEASIAVNKGDFIRYDKPTINNNYTILEGGAYANIKLTQNGQEVSLAQGAGCKIRIKDLDAKASLSYFTATGSKYSSTDSIFAWAPSYNGKALIWYDFPATWKKLGHEITSGSLSWFGSAQFADSTPPRTRVNVLLPLNFTNKNTEVFAVYNNSKTILNLLPSATTRTFYAPAVAINTDITFISISKIDGSYYWGSKRVTVANPNGIAFSPVKKSLKDISNFLNAL